MILADLGGLAGLAWPEELVRAGTVAVAERAEEAGHPGELKGQSDEDEDPLGWGWGLSDDEQQGAGVCRSASVGQTPDR